MAYVVMACVAMAWQNDIQELWPYIDITCIVMAHAVMARQNDVKEHTIDTVLAHTVMPSRTTSKSYGPI